MSIYEDAAESVFDELCESDAGWFSITAETATKLRRGFYGPAGLIDALGQYHFSPSLPEVHSFMQLWQHLHEGDLAAVRLHIGRQPFKDADVEGNNSALQDLTRRSGKRCEAEFWGGWTDHDGYVRLLEPVELRTLSAESPPRTIEHGGPDSLDFPLEVGTQSWSKTVNMLRTLGLLARWPYGSDDVYLFKMRDEAVGRWQEAVMEMLGVES